MQDQHQHLIIKSLSGSLSPEEQQELRVWMDESPENRREYEDYQKVWQLSNPLNEIQDFQTSAEWKKLETAIDQDHISTPHRKSVPFRQSPWLSVAASVAFLVIAALVVYMFLFNSGGNEIVMESGDQEIHFRLPDGSQVWLNRNSTLSYEEEFSEAERNVSLSGEAFFEVEKNRKKPFVIRAEKAEVRVLGTSFNIKAYPEAAQTEVYVKSGKVSLGVQEQEAQKARKIILTPGETGILQKGDLSLNLTKDTSPNVLAWKDNKLVFEKATLRQVVKTLEEYFAVNISVSGSTILECRFTSTFTEPELEEVLEVLRLTLNLTITREGDSLRIKGEGCK